MSVKIIIAGAGLGGLNLAYELGKKGYDVTVIEKETPDTISFDWSDDIERSVFKELSLPVPDASFSHDKPNWSFVPPFGGKLTKINQPLEHTDYSVMRIPFAKMFIDRADKARFLYGVTVLEPIVEGKRVTGVRTDKGDFFGDLIVDNLGAFSPVRAKLPEALGVPNAVDSKELFSAYRGFFARTDAEVSEHTNKAYLKHLGNAGISWCLDRGNSVDVLIGITGKMPEGFVDTALAALRKDNPCLGQKLLSAGGIYKVAIRYPLSKIVADGYAAIGDAAFMTIPILGSGMASSLRAGKYLADVICSSAAPFTTEKLWAYQVKVFKAFGAKHAAIDYMKRWLLGASDNDINFALTSGMLNAEDMALVARGEPIRLTNAEKVQKMKTAYKNPGLLLRLNSLLMSMGKVNTLAQNIPESYDEKSIEKWRRKLDSFMAKA